MSKKQSLLIVIVLVILVATIASGKLIRAQTSGAGARRWEYRLVNVRALHAQAEIDRFAGEGFEMLDFKVTQPAAGIEAQYHMVFKRLRP